jgi:hypothetical protein
MTPYEMEEQLKNLDARTTKIEQFLPTLVTKDDLRLTKAGLLQEMAKLATKDDLRLTTETLRHEMAKFATKDDLHLTTEALQHEMARFATGDDLKAGLEDAKRYTLLLIQTTRGEIRQIREEMIALNGEVRGDIRALSNQIAALSAPSRKKG